MWGRLKIYVRSPKADRVQSDRFEQDRTLPNKGLHLRITMCIWERTQYDWS